MAASNIVIGNTSRRTVAAGGNWIGKGQVIASYEDAIPAQAVKDLLLNWEPVEVANANLVPVTDFELADTVLPDGRPAKTMIVEGVKSIVRSDTFAPLGRFQDGYNSAGYGRMVEFTTEALGDLPIWNAGELKGGRQFFITLGMDESRHDSNTGLDFLPYLMFGSSLDGSLANTWTPGSLVAVCDNMFAAARGAAKAAGRQIKFKRSRFSMTDQRITDLQTALAVLELEAEAMTAFAGGLAEVPLSRSQWIKTLDVLIPLPGEGASAAALTKTENRRQTVDALYQNSPMVSMWTGTAFGAVQAFNTYAHHEQNVRGVNRVERVFDRVLRGDMAQADTDTVAALERVLERELVLA
jgi:phage/plasmid-like protein (TIGR03299 family)